MRVTDKKLIELLDSKTNNIDENGFGIHCKQVDDWESGDVSYLILHDDKFYLLYYTDEDVAMEIDEEEAMSYYFGECDFDEEEWDNFKNGEVVS